ncbi:MAG TPA: hypothetical protein VKP61_03655 [Candidatus Acidoferrum sp.]|nr:hypothetical protein [Candidatus Acidoferrum sp.]
MKTRILVVVVMTLTLVVVFSLSPTHHAQNLKSIVTAVAYVQDEAPVQINSATHGTDFLFSKAEVKNVSEHAVRSVTFGVFIHSSASDHEAPIMASSREIPTHLKPGETRTLDVLDLTLDQAQAKAAQLKSDSVIAEFGILSVKMDDGTTWSTDAERNGGFGRVNAAANRSAADIIHCSPTPSSKLRALLDRVIPSLAVVLAQGYTCAGSTNEELCTNMGQSCTNRVCTHLEVLNGTCPKQNCKLIP